MFDEFSNIRPSTSRDDQTLSSYCTPVICWTVIESLFLCQDPPFKRNNNEWIIKMFIFRCYHAILTGCFQCRRQYQAELRRVKEVFFLFSQYRSFTVFLNISFNKTGEFLKIFEGVIYLSINYIASIASCCRIFLFLVFILDTSHWKNLRSFLSKYCSHGLIFYHFSFKASFCFMPNTAEPKFRLLLEKYSRRQYVHISVAISSLKQK